MKGKKGGEGRGGRRGGKGGRERRGRIPCLELSTLGAEDVLLVELPRRVVVGSVDGRVAARLVHDLMTSRADGTTDNRQQFSEASLGIFNFRCEKEKTKEQRRGRRLIYACV